MDLDDEESDGSDGESEGYADPLPESSRAAHWVEGSQSPNPDRKSLQRPSLQRTNSPTVSYDDLKNFLAEDTLSHAVYRLVNT